MKYCSSCGKQMDDKAAFCPGCGSAVIQQNNWQTTMQQPQVAGNTNFANSSNAKFEIKGLNLLRGFALFIFVISFFLTKIFGLISIVITGTAGLCMTFCNQAKMAKSEEEGKAAMRKGKIACLVTIILLILVVMIWSYVNESLA